MADEPSRIGDQAVTAIEEVLQGVVGRITHERLGVDDQPWLPFRRQHVAGVEVGAQQAFRRGGRWQRAEQVGPLACELRLHQHLSVGDLALEPVGPVVAHRLEAPERRGGRRLAPQPAQQSGDDHVLLALGPLSQRRPGRAPLEQQRRRRPRGPLVGQDTDRAVTVPLAEPGCLVVGLHVPPTDLQHDITKGGGVCRRHPGRLATRLEGRGEGQRPARRDVLDLGRESVEPRPTTVLVARGPEEARHRDGRHDLIVPRPTCQPSLGVSGVASQG